MNHYTANVRFSETQAQTWLILTADRVYATYGYDMWVTSATDGKHGAGSLHSRGLALDLRTKHIDKMETKQAIFAELKHLLSPGFDVVFEDPNGPNEHIHAEYDPDHASNVAVA